MAELFHKIYCYDSVIMATVKQICYSLKKLVNGPWDLELLLLMTLVRFSRAFGWVFHRNWLEAKLSLRCYGNNMRKCLCSLISILNNEQNSVLKGNRLCWTRAVKEGKRKKNGNTRTKVGRVPGNIYKFFKTLKL